MQSASPHHGGTKNTEGLPHLLGVLRVSVARHRDRRISPIALVFGVFVSAVLAVSSCAKSTPAVVAPPTLNAIQQLQSDLTAAAKMPGVQRATWGIAVQSVARNERLFDLN